MQKLRRRIGSNRRGWTRKQQVLLSIALLAPTSFLWSSAITVAPNEVDIGISLPSTVISKTITLKNEGNDTIIIKDVVGSCSCVVPKHEKASLAPGEELAIPLTVKLDPSPRKVAEMLVITTNEPTNNIINVPIAGLSQNIISVRPQRLSFKLNNPSELPNTRTLLIHSRPDTKLSEVHVTSPADFISIESKKRISDTAFEIQIGLTKECPPGEVDAQLSFEADVEAQTSQGVIPVSVVMPATITASPAMLILRHEAGGPGSASSTISGIPDAKLEIISSLQAPNCLHFAMANGTLTLNYQEKCRFNNFHGSVILKDNTTGRRLLSVPFACVNN